MRDNMVWGVAWAEVVPIYLLHSGVSRSTKASEVSSLFTEAGGNAIRCAGVSRYEYSGGLK